MTQLVEVQLQADYFDLTPRFWLHSLENVAYDLLTRSASCVTIIFMAGSGGNCIASFFSWNNFHWSRPIIKELPKGQRGIQLYQWVGKIKKTTHSNFDSQTHLLNLFRRSVPPGKEANRYVSFFTE